MVKLQGLFKAAVVLAFSLLSAGVEIWQTAVFQAHFSCASCATLIFWAAAAVSGFLVSLQARAGTQVGWRFCSCCRPC